MRQNPDGAREPGMVRVYHRLIVLVCVAVAVLACVLFTVSRFRSLAMGEARDLLYDVSAYLLDCARGDREFDPDGQDTGAYYINDPATLAPYREAPIEGVFSVTISKDLKPLFVTNTMRRTFFGRYEWIATASYPEGAGTGSSFIMRKLAPKMSDLKDGEDESHVETMESKAQE